MQLSYDTTYSLQHVDRSNDRETPEEWIWSPNGIQTLLPEVSDMINAVVPHVSVQVRNRYRLLHHGKWLYQCICNPLWTSPSVYAISRRRTVKARETKLLHFMSIVANGDQATQKPCGYKNATIDQSDIRQPWSEDNMRMPWILGRDFNVYCPRIVLLNTI